MGVRMRGFKMVSWILLIVFLGWLGFFLASSPILSLARYPADPYVRVQYPGIFRPDPEAEWLCQHKHQPWYVAPIVKMEETKSEATECGTHKREGGESRGSGAVGRGNHEGD
jgi:hypothetical protein